MGEDTRDELLAEVVERYLGSGDFNGLFIGAGDPRRASAEELVRDRLIEVVAEEDFPNPHIRPWASRRSVDEQVASIAAAAEGESYGVCLYPVSTALAELDEVRALVGRRYTQRLAAGAGHFKYHYDARGNRYCTTLLAGSETDCKAPAGGTITSNLVALSGYDRLNRLNTFRTFGSGVEIDRTTYVYDALDRPYSQRERHGSAGTTREKTFTYLGLSNLLSQETHTNPSRTKTYTYDAFGHRISMTDSVENTTFGYGYDIHGSVSALLDDNADAPEATYGYDPYGAIDTELTQGDINGSEPDQPPEDPLSPLPLHRQTARLRLRHLRHGCPPLRRQLRTIPPTRPLPRSTRQPLPLPRPPHPKPLRTRRRRADQLRRIRRPLPI